MKLILEGQTFADIIAEARRLIEGVEQRGAVIVGAGQLPTRQQAAERPTTPAAPVLEALSTDEPPWPVETIPQAAARVFPEAETKIVQQVDAWPAGACPSHGSEWRDNGRGPFCSRKGGRGPLNDKGYCALRPGMNFEGKRIPLPVAA